MAKYHELLYEFIEKNLYASVSRTLPTKSQDSFCQSVSTEEGISIPVFGQRSRG